VDLPGETTPQISLPSIGLDMDGYRYRCVVRNNCGEVISGIVITSVKAAPKVTGDPEDKLVCETQDAVFAVQAGGYGTLKYLWQVDKKDGRGFVSLAAAGTDSSYTAAAVTETMNGYLFRCVVTGGCAPADTSNMAALTVPVAKIGALADQILCNNTQTAEVNLTSSLAQTTFTWVNTNTKVGLKAGGDGEVIPAFIAVNSGTAADSAKITITPVALGCTGPEKSFTIRVNPTPVISSDAPADLCSDQPFSYAVKSETDKTAFTWTRAAVTGIANAAANGTGNIAETLVNNSTEPVAVTYSYSLTAAGCINVQPVKVTVKPTPVATITGKDICAEENLTLTGSADLKDVTYQWIDVAGKESTEKNIVLNNATVSVGGTYQLTVAKAGCSSVPARYVQKVKPLPVATINGPASVCEGQEIVMKAVSDIGADSYIWSGPSGFVNDQPSFTLKNAGDLYQGTYNLVVVKDGCKSHATGSVVQVNKYPTVTLETSGLACENSTAWMKAYSNLPLSTFVWQGMGVTSIDQQMTIKPVKGDILKYYVTVSRNGCAVKDSVEFVVKRSPVVEMPSIADVCQSVPAFNLNATETTGIAGKGVFSGASVSETGLFNPTVAAGTYVITYSYTSEEGCKDAKTVSFKVYPIPGVDAGTDKTVYEGSSVRLDGYISGNYTKYAWSTPAGLALPSMTSLTPMVTPTENTTYLLAAENSYGCRAVDSVNVSVLKFRVPNSFSPNGDGINDNWNIPGLSKYPNSRVEVYNRWGTKLFVSKGYGKAWDGRYNGSYVPAATYYYLIYLNDGTGKEKPIAGWIEVMR
jgi:gliding motility-associated-like protein